MSNATTGTIPSLLDRVLHLYESVENKRRLGCWSNPEQALRGEIQWHGLARGDATSGDLMPVTAECLHTVWAELIGFRMDRLFQDPDTFLENFLRMKIKKFEELPDDTPIDLNIPVWFGVILEAAILGQEYTFSPTEEPSLSRSPVIEDESDLAESFDFDANPFLSIAKRFYERIRSLVGPEFHVVFPRWFRGPQGVALYLRGFETFLMDLYVNPDFAMRLLRTVTEAEKQYVAWRRSFTGEPTGLGDLFNDDIPLLSPEDYVRFIQPLEKEIHDFYGGIYYWHSCGDITKHIEGISSIGRIELLDLGVSMEDKEQGIANLLEATPADRPVPQVELRVLAHKHIQNASEQQTRTYMEGILGTCRRHGLTRYVLRSSGMSQVHGAAEDIRQLARWVEISRDVQASGT